jgi:hypothetical protein
VNDAIGYSAAGGGEGGEGAGARVAVTRFRTDQIEAEVEAGVGGCIRGLVDFDGDDVIGGVGVEQFAQFDEVDGAGFALSFQWIDGGGGIGEGSGIGQVVAFWSGQEDFRAIDVDGGRVIT